MDPKLKRAKELAAFFLDTLREEGLSSTWARTAGFVRRRLKSRKGRFLPPRDVLAAQAAADTAAWPLLSICVPFYNTPRPFLKALTDSLLAQSCPNWQLCAADASDEDHAGVEEYLRGRLGDKLRYVKVKNRGISANTNAAAALAEGTYLALADHDDVLSPAAVYYMLEAAHRTGAGFLYSDEALFETDPARASVGHFKPDFAPDYLNCCNYICHLSVFKKDLFDAVGGLDPACDGSQDHDLFLKLSERAAPVHVPLVLYFWRTHAGSTSVGTAAKPYVAAAARRAIDAHLARTGAKGRAMDGLFPSTYKVAYEIQGQPLVSVIIPNKDHAEDLDKALRSIAEKTRWPCYEVIVVENNSADPATFAYYREAQARWPAVRVVTYEGPFNFSAVNNFGRRQAKGEYLLLLNNDVEVLTDGWMTELLALCSQPGVGIVGAKLYYPDDTVQHGGVITGLGGFAGHSHKYARRGASGYMFRLATVQDFSAVTAACLMVKSAVYDAVGGMDEGFAVAFNDVDFCLSVGNAGYRILWTPYAELYHYESKSRGLDTRGPAKERFEGERRRLESRYGRARLLRDPFYNPNLTLDREDFSEADVLPAWPMPGPAAR